MIAGPLYFLKFEEGGGGGGGGGCSDYAMICRIGNCGSIPDRGKGYFMFSKVSGSALGPTQHLIYWVPTALSSGIK